jgi:hypothetical protein
MSGFWWANRIGGIPGKQTPLESCFQGYVEHSMMIPDSPSTKTFSLASGIVPLNLFRLEL